MPSKSSAADIMSTEVVSVRDDQDLNSTEVLAESQHIRHLPVTDAAGALVGMLSVRDILHHLTRAGVSRFIPVKELMTEHPVSVSRDTPVAEIAELMREHDISAVPVVEGKRVVGMVSERDFLKLF